MNAHFVTRQACPACGTAGTRTIFQRSYEEPRLRAALESFYRVVGGLDYEALRGADYVVQACPNCGLFYQRDVPDDFLLQKLYEEWISPQKSFERFHAHVSVAREREMAREVALSLALVQPEGARPRVLDYGCGWGEWARAAQAAGAESWGTELSPTRRAACLRAGIQVVPDKELPAESFDVISADQVFEHLPQPAATLALLKAKLRPGGVIRIAVPNGRRIAASLHRFDQELQEPRLGGVNAIAPLEHLNGFTARSLVRLAAGCGLARLMPSWAALGRAFIWPPGLRAKAKQLALPFYLRSRWTTQMWFAAMPHLHVVGQT